MISIPDDGNRFCKNTPCAFVAWTPSRKRETAVSRHSCLLYTSDAADERSSVDLGGRRIIKKKTYVEIVDLRHILNETTDSDSKHIELKEQRGIQMHGRIA